MPPSPARARSKRSVSRSSSASRPTRAVMRERLSRGGWLPHEPVPVREGGRFAAAGRVQLAENVRHVDARGLAADEELLGDLRVRLALGDEREHLDLAVGEAEGIVVAPSGTLVDV